MASSYRLKCGAPQGSVLGPKLYFVYVNATRFYGQDVCIITFADDTDLTVCAKSIGEVVLKVIARGWYIEVFLAKADSPLIYHSVVPYISNDCLIWSSNFYSNFKRFQLLQNNTERIVCKYVKGVNLTSACFKSLNLFKVGQLRDYQAAVFVFQFSTSEHQGG